MGVHIVIYRLGEYDEEGYIEEKNVSEEIGWDTLRVSGDSDFTQDVEFTYKGDHINTDKAGRFYRRPSDFESARKWQSLREVNQNRFSDIFSKMENDQSLYFYFSH